MTIADYDSVCTICGDTVYEGDVIRRDGDGGWAHEECTDLVDEDDDDGRRAEGVRR